MKYHFKLFYVIVCTGIILIGSAALFFYDDIDGTYWKPPLTFLVDEQALQTDKTVYYVGDTIYVRNSLCKNRTSFTASLLS